MNTCYDPMIDLLSSNVQQKMCSFYIKIYLRLNEFYSSTFPFKSLLNSVTFDVSIIEMYRISRERVEIIF